MQFTTLGNFLVVDIHKPMNRDSSLPYDFCRVRKDYFDKAKKTGRYVLVRTPNGERVIMPKHMREFKIVKEVFLFPDNPMPMYEIVVPHTQKKPNEYYQFH